MHKYQVFNLPSNTANRLIMPVLHSRAEIPIICFNCQHVNEFKNNYCVECGYPVVADKNYFTLFTVRQKERRNLVLQCRDRIMGARNSLYIATAFCSLRALTAYFNFGPGLIKSLVFVVLAALFFGLGRWSNFKPFTSLLVSFVLMVTLVMYNTWIELAGLFTHSTGWLIINLQL